jgi:hypothetical protein
MYFFILTLGYLHWEPQILIFIYVQVLRPTFRSRVLAGRAVPARTGLGGVS